MPALSFLVVGTPRSGTTLTQRLCMELPRVAMPPETHFLQLFAPGLLERATWPLSGPDLLRELETFAALPTSKGLRLSADEVAERLQGSAVSLLELFGAIAAAAGGVTCDDVLLGEKTPEHLLWSRCLSRALPDLRVVGVVRDPRAVAASHRGVPWGVEDPGELAEEWAFDQRQLLLTRKVLGPNRCLLLRYRDIVLAPEETRIALGRFLGVDRVVSVAEAPANGLVHDWEWWKAQALQPVTTERLLSWRQVLSEEDARTVVSIAGREMAQLGFLDVSAVPEGKRSSPCRHRLARRLSRVRRLARTVLDQEAAVEPASAYRCEGAASASGTPNAVLSR